MRYRPAPAATPSAAIAHTSAAVVKPNTRSLARIRAPAPRRPIRVMTPPRRVNGLSASKSIARIASAAAPVDTKMNVPKPTGFRRICRSRPIPKARAKTRRSRKTLSAGSIVTREPSPDGASHRAPHAERVYFSFFSTRGEPIERVTACVASFSAMAQCTLDTDHPVARPADARPEPQTIAYASPAWDSAAPAPPFDDFR